MSCKAIQQNIEAYLDGELTLSDRRDFEDHLTGCRPCQARLEAMRALNSSVRKLGYTARPAALRRNIRNGLRDLSGEDAARFSWPHLLGFGGASAGLASVAMWAALNLLGTNPPQVRFSEELIGAHVRSLMADHLTDVTSADRHTVKPWFNGRLDFSPGVTDLKAEGFPLLGGRLEYLHGQPAAALVYKRRAHIINLFIRKIGQPTSAGLQQQQGYNLLSWEAQGLRYTVVSDLNSKELQEFVQLIQGPGH